MSNLHLLNIQHVENTTYQMLVKLVYEDISYLETFEALKLEDINGYQFSDEFSSILRHNSIEDGKQLLSAIKEKISSSTGVV